MSDLPEGWEEVKLKNIGICITGLTYSPQNIVDSGLLVLRSSNVQNSKLAFTDNVYVNVDVSEETKTKYGDILICVRNGSKKLIGKSAFISNLAIGQTHGAFMSLFRSSNTPEYIFQLFQTSMFFRQVNRNLGATINSINSSDLYNFKFPYPPIDERNKIAQILSTWDNAIATTEKQIANSKQQKKALMQQLLTGKKRLAGFSGDWEVVKLGDWLMEYKSKSTIQNQYPVYTSSKKGLVPQEEYFANSRISNRSNIGFNILPPHHITYRSRSDDGLFTFNLFRENHTVIISHYYPVFTSSGSNEFFVSLFEQYKKIFGVYSVGTSQKVLSFNALRKIKIKAPCIQEQQKIAQVLTTADNEISTLETQLTHLQQEKKALMQQLLTGKRRVNI